MLHQFKPKYIDNNCVALLLFVLAYMPKSMEIERCCAIYRDCGCVFCGLSETLVTRSPSVLLTSHIKHKYTHTHTFTSKQINSTLTYARCMRWFMKISLLSTNQVDLFKTYSYCSTQSFENESDTQIFRYIPCAFTPCYTFDTLMLMLLP